MTKDSFKGNGHANQCVKSTSISEGEQLVCECQV